MDVNGLAVLLEKVEGEDRTKDVTAQTKEAVFDNVVGAELSEDMFALKVDRFQPDQNPAEYVAIESSTGKLFYLSCKPKQDPYKLFAEKVYKHDTSGDFDAGNVDIDIYLLKPLAVGEVRELFIGIPR